MDIWPPVSLYLSVHNGLSFLSFFSLSHLHEPSDDLGQFDDDDGDSDGGEKDEGGGEEEEEELEEGGVEERVDAEAELVGVPRALPPSLPSDNHKVLRLHI